MGGRGQWQRLKTVLADLRFVWAVASPPPPLKKQNVDRDRTAGTRQGGPQTTQPSEEATGASSVDEASFPTAGGRGR